MRKNASTLAILIGIILAILPSLAFQTSVTTDEPPPRPPTATPIVGTRIILSFDDQSRCSQAWWTAVQWQDEFGMWNDVEGWQGTFDQNCQVVWWLGPEHYGTGPFRWVVFDSVEREQELTTSKVFNLPSNSYVHLEVEVTVP